MRITQMMSPRQFNQNLQKINQDIHSLQSQIASGKKFEKISDSPLEAMKALSQRSNLMQIEQYQKNVQDGKDRLNAVDDALGNVTNVMQRVRELTVQAENDTLNETDRNNIATEMRSLKEQLGTLANTTFNGRQLFSGMDQNTQPYQNGGLQTVSLSPMSWEIGKGVNVNVNVNAGAVFGFEVDGKNLFQTLDSLVQSLENGESPNELMQTVDKQMDHISNQHAIVGANTNLLEMAGNKLDQANYLSQKVLNETEGTDIAKAYMELSAHETTLNASLAAGAKIMQHTLVDFLR